MASPVTLYIAPDTGLDVTVDKDSISSSNSSLLFEVIRGYSYKLSNIGQFRIKGGHGIVDHNILRGFMSPITPVTLPPYGREKSGIFNPKATQFSFLHPPVGLAAQIDWTRHDDLFYDNPKSTLRDIHEGEHDRSRKTSKKSGSGRPDYSWAIPFISVTGAFAYFDDDLNLVSVNVVTLRKTDYALNLSGPFKTPPTVVSSILETERARVIPLDAFHESSFVAMSWVRPYETIGNYLPSGTNHDNRHGKTINCFHHPKVAQFCSHSDIDH